MKKTFVNMSLKGFIGGTTFALGLFGVVYASNWISTTYNSGGETLTADEGAQLSLSKWNALVGRISGITTQSNGKVALTGTSPDISDNNSEIPSTSAVKTYVDAQVQANSGGATNCPSDITALQTGATLVNAIKGCRDMGGGYRLPTFEELTCFMGDTSISGGATSTLLWTRSEATNSDVAGYYLYLRLSDGYFSRNIYTASMTYRCVR